MRYSATSFALTPARERARQANAHRFRLLRGERLGGEHVLEIARPAGKGERSERADRAGMTVRARVRRARQNEPEFGCDDVRDPRFVVVDVEQTEPEALRARPHLAHQRRFRRRALDFGPVARRRGMIENAERQVGAPDGAAGFAEPFERVRAVQIVKHVTIDVDDVAAVIAPRYEMRIPDLVDERARHRRYVTLRKAILLLGRPRCQTSGRRG